MFYIPQIQKDDCGFACLKMVLANINKDKNYLFLPQDEEHGNYSYSDLMKIGKKEGINFEALKVTEKSELINCSSFPFIATIELKNGAKHAVVVTKIKWKRVFLIDPIKGKYSMSFKNFIKVWDSTGLFIQSFEKKKATPCKITPVSAGNKVLLGIIQMVAIACAVLGVYFIKSDTKIYIPVIFLSGAIISELILKLVSYSIMKNLDIKYFSDEYLPGKGFKKYVQRYEDYKRLSLSSPMNLMLIMVLAVGLVVIVILNDYRNLMLALVPIVLALFHNLFVYPVLKSKRRDIETLEDGLDNAKTLEELKDQVKVVHDKAYYYGYLDIAIRYAYAGIIVLSALLTMRMCGISSFPYIIFYSCVSVTVYKSFDEILSFSERIDEFNKVKVKMINVIKRENENV